MLTFYSGGLFLDQGLRTAVDFIWAHIIKRFIRNLEEKHKQISNSLDARGWMDFDFFSTLPTPQRYEIQPQQRQLNAMARLQSNIAYSFKSQPLLIQAVTHGTVIGDSGYVRLSPGPPTTYQRLEFLGDAIFKFVAGVHCYFAHRDSAEPVKDMHNMREKLIEGKAQKKMGEHVGVREALLVGADFDIDAGKKSPISDALEAIVGALYLETGLDPDFRGCCNHNRNSKSNNNNNSSQGGKVVELLHRLFPHA